MHLLIFSLLWRHNDHDFVSNYQPHGCLLNRLFRRRSKKTSKLRVTGLCVGNSPGPVNSPHKGPVTRKMFPFDVVIMVGLLCGTGMIFCIDIDIIKWKHFPRYWKWILGYRLCWHIYRACMFDDERYIYVHDGQNRALTYVKCHDIIWNCHRAISADGKRCPTRPWTFATKWGNGSRFNTLNFGKKMIDILETILWLLIHFGIFVKSIFWIYYICYIVVDVKMNSTSMNEQLFIAKTFFDTGNYFQYPDDVTNGTTFRTTALCEGNPPVTGGFPSQRPMTRSFDVFFDLRLNKRLSK